MTSISSAPSPPILREKASFGTPLLYASVPLTGAWTSTRMSKVSGKSASCHQAAERLTASDKVDLVRREDTAQLGTRSSTPECLRRGCTQKGQQEDWNEHVSKGGRGATESAFCLHVFIKSGLGASHCTRQHKTLIMTQPRTWDTGMRELYFVCGQRLQGW